MESASNYNKDFKELENNSKNVFWKKFDLEKFFKDTDKVGEILRNREKEEHDERRCNFS